MQYRIYSGLDTGVRRKIAAAAIALTVTIGVPAVTAFIYDQQEIFPGPTLYSSHRSTPGSAENRSNPEPDNDDQSTGQAESSGSISPITHSPEPGLTTRQQQTERPVGGMGGGIEAAEPSSVSTTPLPEQESKPLTEEPEVPDGSVEPGPVAPAPTVGVDVIVGEPVLDLRAEAEAGDVSAEASVGL
jgi:hypothetical protein